MQFFVRQGRLRIEGFSGLSPDRRDKFADILNHFGLNLTSLAVGADGLEMPQFVEDGQGRTDLAPVIGQLLGDILGRERVRRKHDSAVSRAYPVALEFESVCSRARAFADVLEERGEALTDILLRHESYEVVVDETQRTLDLLRSLSETEQYFQRQIGEVATFLPRNQPLYSLALFALVPALIATNVHVKAPLSMESLIRRMTGCLSLRDHFPNVLFAEQERVAFVRERVGRRAGSSAPRTDAVIFTGTMANADRLRAQFDPRTLFIVNGAGHNPVVIAEDADIDSAVSSVVRLQLYNSGQDCANPNAVLVHEQCFSKFMSALREALRQIRSGDYRERANRVGPLSDRRSLPEILKTLLDNAEFLDPSTPGIIHARAAIVEPTIIVRPLKAGGNYTEYFAPIFFVQTYERDEELSLYFDDKRYAPNAMYISLHGESPFVDCLLSRSLSDGRPLHDESTILRNTDLHAPGVERGTKPYGGYGRGASCISIHGQVRAKPTLVPRDLFENLVLPSLEVTPEPKFDLAAAAIAESPRP